MSSITQTTSFSSAQTVPKSKKRLWAGCIISMLAVLFLLFDCSIKFVKPTPAPVLAAFARLGYPPSLAVGLGLILLSCVVVYVIPRTAVLGAILLTGYFGGAVASHLRVGDPLFDTVFPIIFATLIWGGLYLRDDQLRSLVPFRN